MSIDKIIGVVILVLVLIFLCALLLYGMKESLKLDKELKDLEIKKYKLEIEKYTRELQWKIYTINISSDGE